MGALAIARWRQLLACSLLVGRFAVIGALQGDEFGLEVFGDEAFFAHRDDRLFEGLFAGVEGGPDFFRCAFVVERKHALVGRFELF